MKINKIYIERYEKSFISNIKLGNQYFKKRSGWYIKIYANQYCGVGEAAPIPLISIEDYDATGYALEGFKLALEGIDYDVQLEELLLLSKTHGFNVPSAEFAIEAAIYDLFSQANNQSVAQYLNDNALDLININSINHSQSTIAIGDTKVLKVKVDEKNIFSIKDRIDEALKPYSYDTKIRIDFNGGLDLTKAIRVCKELESYNIDYIEQPLPKENIEDFYELRLTTSIPIAIDESVTDYDSVDNIINLGAADVLIVKPTITGSYDEIKKIVKLANKEGLRVVVTSSFETSIAQKYILNIISALQVSEYCGVFNIKLFEDDILPAFIKSNYKINQI